MTSPHEHEHQEVPLDPRVEAKVRELLESELGHPQARPEFRSELKASFLEAAAAKAPVRNRTPKRAARSTPRRSTASGSTRGPGTNVPGTRGSRNRRSARPEPAPRSWFTQPAGIGTLVAAAAAVFLLFRFTGLGGSSPEGALRYLDGSTAVAFLTGSESHSIGSRATGSRVTGGPGAEDAWIEALEAATRDHSPIEVSEGTLRFGIGELFVVELAENTSARFLELPDDVTAAGDRGRVRVEVERGTMRVVTLEGFPGTEMLVSTPFAEVRAVGTQFAVDVFEPDPSYPGPAGTCVCCIEGEVEVRSTTPNLPDGALRTIGANAMGFAYLDGPISPSMAVVPDHAAPLAEFAKAHGPTPR